MMITEYHGHWYFYWITYDRLTPNIKGLKLNLKHGTWQQIMQSGHSIAPT